MINIQQLIKNFDKAANNYLANATIQRTPALRLINLLDKYYDGSTILDLGSGCGTLQHNQSINNYPTYAFDLSMKMLKLNHSKFKINGDAGCLPFADSSFSIIISNLMLQWALDKKQILNEVYRVLKPGGRIILSSLIKPSLYELHQAVMKIDDKPHTLNFLTENEYVCLFNNLKFNIIESYAWIDTVYFPTLIALLQHFKLTGTNLSRSGVSYGLGSRLQLQQLANTYQQHPNGLPLTYSYLLIVASKGAILS